MAWIYLCIAGILEIFWAISLKHSEGFSNLRWSVVTIVGMTASFYFLAQALKTIPVGTAYSIWTCISVRWAPLFLELYYSLNQRPHRGSPASA